MRLLTQSWFVFSFLAALVPGVCAFEASFHNVQGKEGGTFTVADIDANGEKYSLVVPRGWQASVSEEKRSLSFSPKSGQISITITFSVDHPASILTSAESLRQSVAHILNQPTVIEEFPAHAGYASGRGVDLSFLLHGSSMRARVAVIPLSIGHASFLLVCPPDAVTAAQQSFGGTLTSFRKATARAPGKYVKNNQGWESSKWEQRNAEAEVQPELPGPLKPELLVPLGALDPKRPSFLEGKGEYILVALAAALVGALGTYTLVRHKREAEIRLLTGTYLSDGTEAAWITMPAFFATPVNRHAGLDLDKDSEDEEKKEQEAVPLSGPLAEFFKTAPDHLAQIRKVLPELSKPAEDAERKQTFLKLHEIIVALKTKANCWDLWLVWQLTSALELLVKRLADKCKEATPSTTRTIATAVDLLAEICVPGVRPDLIITPPISVLAVDDDPLCLRAVMFALQKAEMTPDTAPTGEAAVLLATEKSYDVVFMDINMPGIDGLEACTQIKKLKKNEDTPVVFVTVQSDFRTRAESTLAGGSDFLAKPFLMFEITVKVLIFAMRKRLGLAASLKREVAALTGASQIEGKAIPVLPPPRPVQAASPTEQKNPDAKEITATKDASIAEAPSGAPTETSPVAGDVPVKAYSGVELPPLQMAPVTPLDREAKLAQTPEQPDRKSKKSKRQKELAKIEK